MKSSTAGGPMTIGDVAAQFGLAPHVLRHWESMGLLDPARATGGSRRYGTDDLFRIAVVIVAKDAGLGLSEIAGMLEAEGPAARRATLRRRRAELAERIARLQASLDMVDAALACEHDDLATCVHFQQVIAERACLDVLPG